jgi:hypothetical protein
MKITIIDQHSGHVHEVPTTQPEPPEPNGFCWFDPEHFPIAETGFNLTEDDEAVPTKRIRFTDGREIEINPNTGDLLTV